MLRKIWIYILVCTLLPLLLIACGGGSGVPTDQGPPLDLVMIANKDAPFSDELYAASIDGVRIEKLSPPFEFDTNDVLDFSISPSGEYVAFRIGYTGGCRLYIVDLKTFKSVEVSAFLGFLQWVNDDYTWSSDGRYLGFTGRKQNDNFYNLYTLRISDRLITLINTTDPMRLIPIKVNSFQWAPDGQSIAYVADEESENKWELYATSPIGTDKRKISDFKETYGGIREYSWSPNSAMIAYLLTLESGASAELYRSFSDGSGKLKLSNGITNTSVQAEALEWSPDSSSVQYLVADAPNNTKNLYVASENGTRNIRISTNVSNSGYVYMAQWSPNGQRILFVAAIDNNEPYELFTATPDGTSLAEISPTGSQLQIISTSTLVSWSPDASRFAFGGSFDSSGYSDLFISAADGSSLIQATELPEQNSTLIDFVWSPDSTKLAYRSINYNTDQITLDLMDTVNSNIPFTVTYLSRSALHITPKWINQGNNLAFVADLNTLIFGELFVSDGVTNITPVSGDFSTNLVSGTGVRNFSEIH